MLQPCCEVLVELVGVSAFEQEQVLDTELLLFVPSKPQPLHVGSGIPRVTNCWIQQIVYSFVVYLQEGHPDCKGPSDTVLLDLAKKLLAYSRDYPVMLGCCLLYSLHRVCLAGACLPISQYRAVVPFDGSIHQLVYFTPSVDL